MLDQKYQKQENKTNNLNGNTNNNSSKQNNDEKSNKLVKTNNKNCYENNKIRITIKMAQIEIITMMVTMVVTIFLIRKITTLMIILTKIIRRNTE